MLAQKPVLAITIIAVIVRLLPDACALLTCKHRGQPRLGAEVASGDLGGPLFLTPLINEGELELAKSLARVGHLNGANVPSYSGYLTVNETDRSNMFFWFFPAFKDASRAPTILWLQGGPGSSSLFGLFLEHGPYEVTDEGLTRIRNSTWAKQFNMLYIDNPVGAGFSFTDRHVTDELQIARNLFEALQQFFTLFSEYAKNDFYIAGESYAGKFVPAAAYMIDQNRDVAKMKLAGIAIGNGLCDPIKQLNYAEFALQTSLIGDSLASRLRAMQKNVKNLLKRGEFIAAKEEWEEIITEVETAGEINVYNFVSDSINATAYKRFINSKQSRQAVHVGNTEFRDFNQSIERYLLASIMRSVKPWIAKLMNNDDYKVMIYSGQLDVIIATPLTISFINSIQWDGADDLANADRIIWHNPHTHKPAGYVRHVRRFTEVVIRNAGHMAPFDQPENAYDMMDRFVNDKPFF